MQREEVEPFAQSISLQSHTLDQEWEAILTEAQRSAKRKDSDVLRGTRVHPVCLGACFLFSDGKQLTAGMIKGLEYGCSLDPIVALLHETFEHLSSHKGVTVRMAMSDQHGVFHTPFAQARALFVEHGFAMRASIIYTAVTQAETDEAQFVGKLRVISLHDLVPPISNSGHDGMLDFNHDGFAGAATTVSCP